VPPGDRRGAYPRARPAWSGLPRSESRSRRAVVFVGSAAGSRQDGAARKSRAPGGVVLGGALPHTPAQSLAGPRHPAPLPARARRARRRSAGPTCRTVAPHPGSVPPPLKLRRSRRGRGEGRALSYQSGCAGAVAVERQRDVDVLPQGVGDRFPVFLALEQRLPRVKMLRLVEVAVGDVGIVLEAGH
jgi:hypothetical protein